MKILKKLWKHDGVFLIVLRIHPMKFRKIITAGFAFPIISHTFVPLNRGMEQLVARRAHNPKVTGSSPVPATMKDTGNSILFLFYAFQLVGLLSAAADTGSPDSYRGCSRYYEGYWKRYPFLFSTY
jgi:hypothetical protein